MRGHAEIRDLTSITTEKSDTVQMGAHNKDGNGAS